MVVDPTRSSPRKSSRSWTVSATTQLSQWSFVRNGILRYVENVSSWKSPTSVAFRNSLFYWMDYFLARIISFVRTGIASGTRRQPRAANVRLRDRILRREDRELSVVLRTVAESVRLSRNVRWTNENRSLVGITCVRQGFDECSRSTLG